MHQLIPNKELIMKMLKLGDLNILYVFLVPKYPPSNLTGHNASSTELYLSWDSVPVEDTYKELRGYVVYVTEADTSLFVKNITTDASTLEVYIDDLRKFKTYTLYIRAMTINVGVQSIILNMTTSEDGNYFMNYLIFVL